MALSTSPLINFLFASPKAAHLTSSLSTVTFAPMSSVRGWRFVLIQHDSAFQFGFRDGVEVCALIKVAAISHDHPAT